MHVGGVDGAPDTEACSPTSFRSINLQEDQPKKVADLIIGFLHG